jgi:hypothetical protein
LKQTLENLSSSSASETGQLSIKLSDLSRSLANAKTQLQQKIEIISNLSTEVKRFFIISFVLLIFIPSYFIFVEYRYEREHD